VVVGLVDRPAGGGEMQRCIVGAGAWYLSFEAVAAGVAHN